MLRFNGNKLEQLLRIQRSYPCPNNTVRVDVFDEWRPVTDTEFSSLLGRTKYSDIGWLSLDWTKQDAELARELSLSPTVVRSYRRRLNQPRSPRSGQHAEGRKVDMEVVAKADWANFRDVDLARQWGITRERVRQLREQLKAPPCRFGRHSPAAVKILLWLEKNRAEVEDKQASEIAKLIPYDYTLLTVYKCLRASGIPFKWCSNRKPERPIDEMNWELPNRVLEIVWHVSRNRAGIYRYLQKKQPPRWDARGKRKLEELPPELLEALRAELKKAKEHGYETSEEAALRPMVTLKGEHYSPEGRRCRPPIVRNKILNFMLQMSSDFTARDLQAHINRNSPEPVKLSSVMNALSLSKGKLVIPINRRNGRQPMIYRRATLPEAPATLPVSEPDHKTCSPESSPVVETLRCIPDAAPDVADPETMLCAPDCPAQFSSAGTGQ
jgi:hypothetical protein